MASFGRNKSTGYKSEFAGTKRSQTNIGNLVQGGTYRNRAGTLVNYSKLNPNLQPLESNFIRGSINNSEVLAQSPAQRIADIQAGNNAFYNVSNEIANRQLKTNLNNNFQAMQNRGLGNSTITGGIQGQLLSDAELRNQQMQLAALQGENALAQSNFNTLFGGLGDLAQLQFAAGNGANANYLQAKAALDANKQFNENFQAANPKSSFLGSVGNFLGGAAQTALGALTLNPQAVGQGIGQQFNSMFGGQPGTPISAVPTGGVGNQFSNLPQFGGNRATQPVYGSNLYSPHQPYYASVNFTGNTI